jgi:hypothetical protein
MLYIPDEFSPELHEQMYRLVTDTLTEKNIPNAAEIAGHVITRLLVELLQGTQPYIAKIPQSCKYAEMFKRYKVRNKRALCIEFGISEAHFDKLYAEFRRSKQSRLI